ncbi:hypothetical protein LTR95_019653, partial [Oleoguttula sp. CCFEE 5521]
WRMDGDLAMYALADSHQYLYFHRERTTGDPGAGWQRRHIRRCVHRGNVDGGSLHSDSPKGCNDGRHFL